MKALTLPDGQDQIAVWPANGTSAVMLVAQDVSGGGGISTNGDVEQGETDVAPSATEIINQFSLDSTGFASAWFLCAGCVHVASETGNGSCTFTVLLDDAPLSPPQGCIIEVATGETVAYAVNAFVVFGSAGPHTVKLVCTSDANTQTAVNPGGVVSSTVLALFIPA